jgi:DNA-binding IclR family transcriptional regulator
VFDHTGAIAMAVTTLGPAGSFDPDWEGQLAGALHSCAQDVSRKLGYPPR